MLKNLLAISWAMPPLLFPRSIQVAITLRGLKQQGWNTTVLSVSPSSVPGAALDPKLEETYQDAYRNIQIPMLPPYEDRHDPLSLRWLSPALLFARDLIERRIYTHVITFAQPWVDHLIGLNLRRMLKLSRFFEIYKYHSIPWIVHFSDPWVDNPNNLTTSPETTRFWEENGEQMKQWEKKIILQADRVVFTNQQTAELVMRKYPSAWGEKVSVIPHSYDSNLDAEVFSSPSKNGRLRLVYTGNLYGQRSPEGLLRALSQSDSSEIEVEFVGFAEPSFHDLAHTLGLSANVTFCDRVSYLESLQKAASADVLLVIDAPSSEPNPFLPSKLVDYLKFKKPILGLTPERGASADLIRSLGCLAIAPDDPFAIEKALKELLKAWKKNQLNVAKQFEKTAAKYDIQQTGEVWSNLLLETTGKGRITIFDRRL